MNYDEWRDTYSRHGLMNEAMARAAWKAAVTETLELCEKECDAIAKERLALCTGRPPYTGREFGRKSDFVHGESAGAEQCAKAIRRKIDGS